MLVVKSRLSKPALRTIVESKKCIITKGKENTMKQKEINSDLKENAIVAQKLKFDQK